MFLNFCWCFFSLSPLLCNYSKTVVSAYLCTPWIQLVEFSGDFISDLWNCLSDLFIPNRKWWTSSSSLISSYLPLTDAAKRPCVAVHTSIAQWGTHFFLCPTLKPLMFAVLKRFANTHQWHRLNKSPRGKCMIFDISLYVFVWYDPGYTSIKIGEAASFFLPNVIQQNHKILQPDFFFLLHHLKITSMLNENLFRCKWAVKT